LRVALEIITNIIPLLIRTRSLLPVLILWLASGCVGTKYLETNQSLVIQQAEIKGVKKEHREEMQDLVALQPNKRLFGILPFTYLVYAYHLGERNFRPERHQKKISKLTSKYDSKIEKTLNEKRKVRLLNKKTAKIDKARINIEEGNGLMRLGEPLAVFDTSKIGNSIARLQTYLTTHGYFKAKIDHTITQQSPKKSFMIYQIKPGAQYVIDSIEWQVGDSTILKLMLAKSKNQLVEKGQAYNQENLEKERNRIYDIMTNTGYFTFSRQFIGFEVDTFSLGSNKILLREKISNPIGDKHRRFTIDSIVFYSGRRRAELISTANYEGIQYQFTERKYNPKVLSQRIFLENDSLYSRANAIKTQRQLSYLDAFRFVNINYDSISDHQLIANIFTSPLNRYQTSFEAGAISASQPIPGPFINLGLKNRNAFNSLEIIDLQGNFSIQGLTSVSDESEPFSLIQYGGSASMTFPRFLFPLTKELREKIGSFNPQTKARISYNYEFRNDEYERSRAEFNFSYLWTTEERSQFTFTPVTFSFIDVPVIFSDFEDILNEQLANGNGALKAAFNSSVISSTSFEAMYQLIPNQSNGEKAFLRLFMETGGNLVNILGEDFFLRNNRIAEDEFSLFRWTKFNADYRRVHVLQNSAHLAYRVNFGFAYPYGKDPSLPYEKRFYIGGSNSLRAWQVRRLGPGAYGVLKDREADNQLIDNVDYQLEQGGDMILESSLEYRKKLIGFVDYAFFIDAGNIWLVNSNFNLKDDQGDDGFFRFDSFFKEIALGAGVGLRLDFSFFVFRLDGAIQIHDPAQLEGNRWVIDNVPLGKIGRLSETEKNILRNKTNITLGIGLPF
jgi:outer membrane protein insertion porin family